MIRQICVKGRQYLILSAIVLMMVLLGLGKYTQITMEKLYEQNRKIVEESTKDTVKAMEELILQGEESLDLASGIVEESGKTSEIDISKLSRWKSSTPFSVIEFVDKQGMAVTIEGDTKEVSEQECFLDGMQGNSGMEVLYNYGKRQQVLINFYKPVKIEGKIIGVLSAYVDQDEILEFLETIRSEKDIRGYLCLEDGTVLITNDVESEKNAFSILDTVYQVDIKQLSAMETTVQSGKTYSFSYDGRVETGNVSVCEIEQLGWIAVKAMPAGVNKELLGKIERVSSVAGIGFSVVFIFFVGFGLLVHWKKQQEYVVKNKKLEQTINCTNQVTRVYEETMKRTAEAFEEIFLVNLNKNQFQMIYPKMEETKRNNYEKIINTKFENGEIINEEGIRDFLSIKGMKKNLIDQDYVEKKYRRVHGREERWWCLASLIVMERKKGKPVTVTLAIRSINELMEKEERQKSLLHIAVECEEAANYAKTEFLSRMSHDIRTPMNAVIGMTSIAEANLGNKEKVSECLKKITTASGHLLSLINEVLDMSKIGSGRMSLAKENFQLSDLLNGIINMVKGEADKRKHQISVSIKKVKHPYVIGDTIKLQQIFVNLLSNSIKYTPDGGNISIDVSEMPGPNGEFGIYLFIFKDNGIGMSQEFLERIFEPFEREEDARISKIQGTGLGMSIAYGLVTLMNGNIDVESKEGIGSKFIITLPLRIQTEPVQAEKVEYKRRKDSSELENTDYSQKTILLVEDNELNREIAVEILKTTGVKIDTAEDGSEAVKMLRESEEGTYNLVLMDIRMPIMDGYEATEAIRATKREDIQGIPIIAMTADAFAEDVHAAKAAGMNGHIAKPLDVEKLSEELHKWL